VKLLVEVVYQALKFFGWIVFHIPARVKSAITLLAANFIYYFLPFRRQIILHNLALCFPRKREESMASYRDRCENIARRNYQHYLLVILEILERFHWNLRIVEQRVKSVGFEQLFKLRDDQKGYFFLTAHLGNWELLTFYGVVRGIPLTIITRFLRAGFWDEIWVRSRKEFGLQLLNESGSGLAIIRAIRKDSRGVGFIMDQHTGLPHGVLQQFFGVPAWCPKGLAILSIKLDCPIMPAYMVRTSPGHFLVTIDPPLKLQSKDRNTDDQEVLSHIGICNQNMEQWIQRYPDQYLWIHKRFKETFDYSQPLPWQS